jgi:hypothetical protein
MVKSWNDRPNTPGINGIKPSPRSFADVVEGQPMLVPTARQVDDFTARSPAAWTWTCVLCGPRSPSGMVRK